jgi:hypothetical protein
MKPTSRKKSRERKATMQTMLMVDEFDFIIAVEADALQDVL